MTFNFIRLTSFVCFVETIVSFYDNITINTNMDALSVSSKDATEWIGCGQTRVKSSDRRINERELFAVKTAALLYLRGVNSKLEFQLACDVEEADNLVDFVLKYKTYDEPKMWRTSFIQLQPKSENELALRLGTLAKSKSEVFSLQRYFKSFSYLKRKMENQDEGLLFNGAIDRCDFILYTDIRVNKELVNRRREEISAPVSKFLISKQDEENVLPVHFTERTDTDIYSALDINSGPEAKEFLKKLMVFPGQPNEAEMDKLIKKELELFCRYHKKHVDVIFNFFLEAVENWWHKDQAHFLHNNSSILEHSIQHFTAQCISSEQKKACTVDITFNKKALDSLRKIIVQCSKHDNKLWRVLTNRHSLKMSCSKVLQILESEGELSSCVSLNTLLNEQEILIPCWKDGRNSYLVIVCNSWSFTNEKLIRRIVSVLKEHLKKVVIIHTPRDMFADRLREALHYQSEDYPDIFKTSQLSKELVTGIAETEVVLQDSKSICLKEILNMQSRPSEIVMSNNFFQIFNKDVIYVGNKLADESRYYIPRVLKRSIALKKRLLRKYPEKCVIAVSGVPREHLDSLVSPDKGKRLESKCSFLYLNSRTASDDFDKLSITTPNAHWLHITEDSLKWKKSKGSVYQLSQFIDKNRFTRRTPVTAFDVTDARVVLIAAESGSGKTSMLIDIAQHTKKAHPATWVLLVKLAEHVALLDQEGGGNATVFLMAAAGIDAKSPLERDLFRFSIEQSGNMVVLLDGLNDLDNGHMEKFFSFLRNLLQTKVDKVWLTTDLLTKSGWEDYLSTFAFTLQNLRGDAKKVISSNSRITYQNNYF